VCHHMQHAFSHCLCLATIFAKVVHRNSVEVGHTRSVYAEEVLAHINSRALTARIRLSHTGLGAVMPFALEPSAFCRCYRRLQR
jgi:hypothetical protein